MLPELDTLLIALTVHPGNEQQIKKAAEHLLKASKRAAAGEGSEAVHKLAPHILHDIPKHSVMAATICGSMAEAGADPAAMEAPLIERLMPLLRRMVDEPQQPVIEEPAPAMETARPKRKAPGLFGMFLRLPINLFRLARAEKKHRQAAEKRTYTDFREYGRGLVTPAIAMFSASPALRKKHAEVHELARALKELEACCEWLCGVFEVLDNEPLLVIEPATKTGILARVSGADVNFILTMLLMQHFPDAGGQTRCRLSPRAVKALEGDCSHAGETVTGSWNLWNWTGLDGNGTLPGGQTQTEHWIWNEGTPSDIAMFEDRRVILLGPPAYPRMWPAQRTYCALKPACSSNKYSRKRKQPPGSTK